MQLKSISLVKFLNLYLGITNEVLRTMTHDDIKVLLPNLKRCSNEYAYCNSALVLRGSIIIVSDARGIIVPYLKPTEEMELVGAAIYAEANKEVGKREISDYNELTNYELRCLLNSSRNGYAVAKKARQELSSRGQLPVKQKIKKKEKRKYYFKNYVEE